MKTQYDILSKEFEYADQNFPDVTRPILYSLIEGNKGKLLDLGCGYGEDLSYFSNKGFEVYGIDISKEMVKKSIGKGLNIKAEVSNFEDIHHESNKFDILFSRYALQHSENIEKIFNEAHRVLKEDGAFVFLVTHPFRHYFEKQTKDYWKAEICVSSILGGKVTVEEPSHTLDEYINPMILSKFSLENMLEEFDPAAKIIEGAGKYPSVLIQKYRKK